MQKQSGKPASLSANRRTVLQSALAAAALPLPAFGGADKEWKLWYRQPATQWVEALPIGNGQLGAMVFGGIGQERLQLNECTLWNAGPYTPANPDSLGALPEVRKLVFEGKYLEAQNLAQEKMMSKPIRQMSYQPAGDVVLSFEALDSATDYDRGLDLDTAIARTMMRSGSTTFEREVFVSAPDQVLVFRVTAKSERKGADGSTRKATTSFNLALSSLQSSSVATETGNLICLSGKNRDQNGIEGKLKFEILAKVITDGSVSANLTSLTVTGATEAVVLVSAATSFRKYDDIGGDPAAIVNDRIARASAKTFQQLRDAHLAAHQKLFRRMAIDLGGNSAAIVPTDERVQETSLSIDPALAALYFQYGRYLLISSSRPGSQPANLQGIWNDLLNPPWNSKYTININTEMNYWIAESGNLAECFEPLVAMVEDLSAAGAVTARIQYGAHGWVAHHNTDIWRATAPIDSAFYGLWPMGGAWLCNQLWDHYDYTRDGDYLARIYPLMKGAAEFFVDVLVHDPKHGWLVTCPSMSPENMHPYGTSTCAGPTMDCAILRDLFEHTVAAGKTLGRDAEFLAVLEKTASQLPPYQIGKAGQLQEWLEDWDIEAPEINHRHVSHLYGLFPSQQITARETPKLAAAARRSLTIRGDEATGWGTAWRAALWARLGDGDRAFSILARLLTPRTTYPNLFDSCPPFQIDGNFGGAAAIAEMLVQSRNGEIVLLPALPGAWRNGSVQGMRVRGSFEVDVFWQNGTLEHATVKSLRGGTTSVRHGNSVAKAALKAGRTRVFTLKNGTLA